jgi:hypothetical protein
MRLGGRLAGLLVSTPPDAEAFVIVAGRATHVPDRTDKSGTERTTTDNSTT